MGMLDGHAHVPDLLADTREAVPCQLKFGISRAPKLMIDLGAHTHNGTDRALAHGIECLANVRVMPDLIPHTALQTGTQVEVRQGIDLHANGVVLELGDGIDTVNLLRIEGNLPGFLLVGAEQHHLFVDVFPGGILHVGILLVIRHPHHHVCQPALGEVVPFPDVVSEVISEVFVGHDPVHPEFNAHGFGNLFAHFHVNATGFSVHLVGVRREVFINTNFQITGFENDVVGSLRRPVQ